MSQVQGYKLSPPRIRQHFYALLSARGSCTWQCTFSFHLASGALCLGTSDSKVGPTCAVEMNFTVDLCCRIKRAIPSLYSLLPFLQLLSQALKLGFAWPEAAQALTVPASLFDLNLNLSFHQCFLSLDFASEWALYLSVPWCFGASKLAKWALGNALKSSGGVLQRISWIPDSNKDTVRNEYIADTIFVLGTFASRNLFCASASETRIVNRGHNDSVLSKSVVHLLVPTNLQGRKTSWLISCVSPLNHLL